MGKIWLIIKREYLTRVRNRTFIVMTIMGPLLIVGFYALIIGISISQKEKPHIVNVINESPVDLLGTFKKYDILHPKSNVKFIFTYQDPNIVKQKLLEGKEFQSYLVLPPDPLAHSNQIGLVYKEKPSYGIKAIIDAEVNKMLEDLKMEDLGVDPTYKDSIHTSISIPMKDIDKVGTKEENLASEIDTMRMIIGIVFGVAIYFFIFLYGVQVFRSVMEEKTNRIVEVVISSVKPFQLMIGKILGVALVGLTQFFILISFTGIVITVLTMALAPTLAEQVQAGSMESQAQMGNIKASTLLNAFYYTQYQLMIPVFIFYFIFGYLLYASLFAAVGSAVDSESDSQQFMLPITLPLIFSFAMGQYVIQDPNSPLSTFLSIFPFTSPVIMMARLALSDEQIIGQLLISMAVLVVTFFIIVKFAAKIYRTGILMYGKKPSYKEIFKWLRYK